jgi:hypothetical protein
MISERHMVARTAAPVERHMVARTAAPVGGHAGSSNILKPIVPARPECGIIGIVLIGAPGGLLNGLPPF